MKKIILLTGLLIAACLLSGCETTGLSVRERDASTYSRMVHRLALSQTNAPTRLPSRPIILAVAQVGEAAPAKEMMLELSKHPHVITRLLPVPLPGEQPGSYYRDRPSFEDRDRDLDAQVENIRRLAKAMGADHLLVIGGSIDTRTARNALGILDITLVAGWIIPSTRIHAAGKAAGTLVEVESGTVQLTCDVQRRSTSMAPTYFVNQNVDGLREKLRGELAVAFAEEFVRKVQPL